MDLNDDGILDGRYLYCVDLDGDSNQDDIFADVGTHDRCDILIDADTDGDRQVDNWTSDGEDTDNDGYIVGVDLNGNGDRNDWVGIDECMQVQNGLYWDDELASDLNTLSYKKLSFVRQGCVEEGEGCFGGGLIDDISAPNRIVMTATDETHHSIGDMDDDGFSEWSEVFIDALHGEETHYDPINHVVVHEGVSVHADLNGDGIVSMWEAWRYAWENDDARIAGLETPWLDDDGNGLPTYMQGHDVLDEDDGLLSYRTLFTSERPKSTDVNWDRGVDILDISSVTRAWLTVPGDPLWNPYVDFDNNDYITSSTLRG